MTGKKAGKKPSAHQQRAGKVRRAQEIAQSESAAIQRRNGGPLLEPPIPPKSQAERGVAMVLYHDGRDRLEITDAICRHIVEGMKLSEACDREGIRWHVFWEWRLQDPEIFQRYARAREASAEAWEDKATFHVEQATVETVQLQRLREDNSRWRARMANPKKFSERAQDLQSVAESIGLEMLLAGAYRKRMGSGE